MTESLVCEDVWAGYGDRLVLRALDMSVRAGETLAVLGPSGSGKSTLLSTVAGFVRSRQGAIRLDGRVLEGEGTWIGPEARAVGFVFQDFALWPHMTALETVAYPFRRSGLSRSAARARAGEILDRLAIGELAHRRPSQLSGGQQQRVGLARALARRPRLYLFDEPTSHLDSPLRASLQELVTEERRQEGAAAVYSTHDAPEALAVSDRLALLVDGRIVQMGSPLEVYERPVDRTAAGLTGPYSVILAEVRPSSFGRGLVDLGAGVADIALDGPVTAGRSEILLRPEWARLGGGAPAVVASVWFRGTHTDYRLDTPRGTVDVRMPGPPAAAQGERVGWAVERGWVLSSGEHRGRSGVGESLVDDSELSL